MRARGLLIVLALAWLLAGCATAKPTPTYQVIECPAPLTWAECVERHGGR